MKGEGTLYVLVHLGPIQTTKEGMLQFENEVHTLIFKIKHACTLQGYYYYRVGDHKEKKGWQQLKERNEIE
jgi:hypothetical protein